MAPPPEWAEEEDATQAAERERESKQANNGASALPSEFNNIPMAMGTVGTDQGGTKEYKLQLGKPH